jgi:hypothetical protein
VPVVAADLGDPVPEVRRPTPYPAPLWHCLTHAALQISCWPGAGWGSEGYTVPQVGPHVLLPPLLFLREAKPMPDATRPAPTRPTLAAPSPTPRPSPVLFYLLCCAVVAAAVVWDVSLQRAAGVWRGRRGSPFTSHVPRMPER